MPSLRDLGLSEYEARSYRSLLKTGPTTAKELSRTSEVPMGRIYDVLNGLEQHSLVRSQTAGRPKKYVAVEPEAALDRLLEAKKRELDEQAKQYEEVVDTLIDDIDTGEPATNQFWTAAVGPEDALELLLERVSTAEEELIYVVSAPAPGIDFRSATDRATEKMGATLERGVEVDLLVAPSVIANLPEQNIKEYLARLTQYENFDIRAHDSVSSTFIVLDGAEVCIEVPNPLDPAETFGMIDLKDAAFATDMREEFASRWDQADPLEPID